MFAGIFVSTMPHTTDTRTAKIISAQDGFKRFSYKMLGSCHAGLSPEDIAQETALRVWQRRDSLRADGDVVPYGLCIAGNLGRDELRKSKRFAPGGLEACNPRALRSREENPLVKSLVQQGMDCLDARQRTIVELFYWEGWTTAEIGQHLGLKEGHVQVTLHRARHKMKARLTMAAA